MSSQPLKWIRVLSLGALLACETAAAGIVKAIEYLGDHVFLTANPAEIAALDSGIVPGWKRSGVELWVHDAPGPGLVPVCRFYSAAFAPRSSHFYSADTAECDALRSNSDWTYEGTAFYARLPDGNGYCPLDSAPVYRWFNNGWYGAPNHRFTPYWSETLAHAGWTLEGIQPGGAASLCMHWGLGYTFDLSKPGSVALELLKGGTWEFVVDRGDRTVVFHIDFASPPDPSLLDVTFLPSQSLAIQRGSKVGFAEWNYWAGEVTVGLALAGRGWWGVDIEWMSLVIVGGDMAFGCWHGEAYYEVAWPIGGGPLPGPCHPLVARRR